MTALRPPAVGDELDLATLGPIAAGRVLAGRGTVTIVRPSPVAGRVHVVIRTPAGFLHTDLSVAAEAAA